MTAPYIELYVIKRVGLPTVQNLGEPVTALSLNNWTRFEWFGSVYEASVCCSGKISLKTKKKKFEVI